jgi:hypothetical protein
MHLVIVLQHSAATLSRCLVVDTIAALAKRVSMQYIAIVHVLRL